MRELPGHSGTSLGRAMRTQVATMSRVKVKAVKTVVRMPSARVTAKPRTGPEPRPNSTTAAMSVVTLESKMVPKAPA